MAEVVHAPATYQYTDVIKRVEREGDVQGRLAFGDGSEMGGFKRTFWCSALIEPKGNLEHLELGFAAMNGGDIAKLILSSGESGVAIVCAVPVEFQSDCVMEDRTRRAVTADEWVGYGNHFPTTLNTV